MPGVNRIRGRQYLSSCALDHARGEGIDATCPVTCLQHVLSAKAYRPLYRAQFERANAVRLVGDVFELHDQCRLRELRGLSPRSVGEIEACLAYICLRR